jgi:hypothetical protein
VVSLDQLKQELTMSLFEIRKWTDVRLSYNLSTRALCVVGAGTRTQTWIPLESNDFEGSDKVVWTPSTYVVNQRHVSSDGEKLMYLYPTGEVIQKTQKTLGTACPMNFGKVRRSFRNDFDLL